MSRYYSSTRTVVYEVQMYHQYHQDFDEAYLPIFETFHTEEEAVAEAKRRSVEGGLYFNVTVTCVERTVERTLVWK